MNDTNIKISKNIRELRKQYGYTQKQIAEKLNIDLKHYQLFESSIVSIPLEKIIILAEIFDVSIDYLVLRKEI